MNAALSVPFKEYIFSTTLDRVKEGATLIKGDIKNEVEKIKTVKIFTLDGIQVTYAQPSSNFYSFDMSLLPKATYLIQVWDVNGEMSSEKVVRQ